MELFKKIVTVFLVLNVFAKNFYLGAKRLDQIFLRHCKVEYERIGPTVFFVENLITTRLKKSEMQNDGLNQV